VGQEGGGGGPYQWCGLWGYRNDHDGGLMHVGARYYEVETGRFTTIDPYLLMLNPYLYSMDDPINFIDPDGYYGVALTIAGGAAIVDGPLPIGDIIAIGIVIGIGASIIFARPSIGPEDIDWKTGKPKGKGWEKKGKEWHRRKTNEWVHPDLDSKIHGPHVDYTDPKGNEWRFYPDGRIEPKRR